MKKCHTDQNSNKMTKIHDCHKITTILISYFTKNVRENRIKI